MIVVTGANGFVGRAVSAAISSRGLRSRLLSRSSAEGMFEVGTIDGMTDWSTVLAGADAVIHLAARVHMFNDRAIDPLIEFRRTNVDATLNLARQAVMAGVRRFIFVSSIKVNGEETMPGLPFKPEDSVNPIDPYGISNYEAEEGLLAIGRETALEVVIVRPPLMYGPGVRANFATMMNWIARGIPLPFGAVRNNRRSLFAVENMADFLLRCVDHKKAAGQTFLVSDGEDLSTAELLRRLGIALGRSARLISVPTPILVAAGHLAKREHITQRLLGSLQIDSSKARELLDWVPPLSVSDALARTAEDFNRINLNQKSSKFSNPIQSRSRWFSSFT
jgi:nucleoside-diphosphate-sugar epimerase